MARSRIVAAWRVLASAVFAAVAAWCAPVRAGAAPLSGSYVRADGSYLDVRQVTHGSIEYYLYASWGRQFGWHSGQAWGAAALNGRSATAHAGKGRLILVFKGDRVRVTQIGSDLDCDFGANVNASGEYVRQPGRPAVGSRHAGRVIQFSRGQNAAIVDGQAALAPHTYRLSVASGQRCRIRLDVSEGQAALRLISPTGRRIATIAPGAAWSGVLRLAGRYRLRVTPLHGIAAYSLEVAKLPASPAPRHGPAADPEAARDRARFTGQPAAHDFGRSLASAPARHGALRLARVAGRR